MTTQEQIINRAKELGFEQQGEFWYKKWLPLGWNNEIVIEVRSKGNLLIKVRQHYTSIIVPIREVESLEDFELLYNAILPEKYRLPFT
jgi:hypothetical protein